MFTPMAPELTGSTKHLHASFFFRFLPIAERETMKKEQLERTFSIQFAREHVFKLPSQLRL